MKFLINLSCHPPNFVRTFTQVSGQWQDTDSMREELDDLQVRNCWNFSLWNSEICIFIIIVSFSCFFVIYILFWTKFWERQTIDLSLIAWADFLEHKMGYFVEFACWDVPCKQVSCIIYLLHIFSLSIWLREFPLFWFNL
jgi:magnesium-transporting ATPase (P-type)